MVQRIKHELLVLRYLFWIYSDCKKKVFLQSLNILNSNQTIDYIASTKCSVSRFGDGEFMLIGGESNGFQKRNPELALRMKNVLNTPKPDLLICIPYTFKSIKECSTSSRLFISEFIHNHLSSKCIPYINPQYTYGDSLFTRFYMSKRNKRKSQLKSYIDNLKKLWDNEEVLIVEGKYSQVGVGNDLFNNAKSIIRITCPPQNAFDKYNLILDQVIKYAYNRLVLMSLGMTATVMAYDLLDYNIRSIDIGHIDTEYEWYKKGAKTKIKLENKIVDEVDNGNSFLFNPNKEYLNQIVAKIE